MDLARPNFHGRHNGRGSVLWADGHGSMFAPIPVPLYATVGTGFTSLKMDPSFYRSKKIGYVAKSADDLQSMSALYYFVSKKAVLAPNDVNLTVKQFFE
jgi:prepilin-type processing-associated H-X9-DG protein